MWKSRVGCTEAPLAYKHLCSIPFTPSLVPKGSSVGRCTDPSTAWEDSRRSQTFRLTDAPSTLIQSLPGHLHLHLELRKPEQRSQVTCRHCMMAHIKKKNAFLTFIYLMCVWGGSCVKVRRQHSGIGSTMWFLGIRLKSAGLLQAPLPTEPSLQPLSTLIKLRCMLEPYNIVG